MTSLTNPHPTPSAPIQDFNYLCASIANVSNFVSVELSSTPSYNHWKMQMLCLMKSHNMVELVDDTISPRVLKKETRNQYDSLLKGWIFGSVSKEVLDQVIDLVSAKDVWEKLKSLYDTTSPQQASAPTNAQGAVTVVITEDPLRNLHRATLKGDWSEAESILKNNIDSVKKAICNDGSTILHVAVGKGHKVFTEKLLLYMHTEDVLNQRSSDKSTALHIAATVGNTYAAKLLVKKNQALLPMKDSNGQHALHIAYENLNLDTVEYLLKATNNGAGVDIGVDLLVNAISAMQYNLASKLIIKSPKLAVENGDVLMAIAKNFPSGLGYWEKYFYPSFGNISKTISSTGLTIIGAVWSVLVIIYNCLGSMSIAHVPWSLVPKRILIFVYQLIYFPILVVCFLFLIVLYYPLWMAVQILVLTLFTRWKKKKHWEEAKNVLRLVCNEIDKLETPARDSYYNKTILEAACQGAYKVVDEILFRSPEAFESTDGEGHGIIQLAVLNRSVKIYNLIYNIGERKNVYRKMIDSSNNNILHLVGRLPASYKQIQRSNPALELQSELQWYLEVKKLVFPAYINQKNNAKQTAHMVFAKEHVNLMKAGGNWMKSTAKSGSIIAALVTTIVFTAAITVPGGSDPNTGLPILKDSKAFTIFLIADVISLCGSTTAILAFLSILIAPFSENYFLFILPFRMLLGHFALFVSTISLMVAYVATIFMVFFHENKLLLGIACSAVALPILYFMIIEIPIIADLFWSTIIRIFGKRRKSAYIRYHPDNVRLCFAV